MPARRVLKWQDRLPLKYVTESRLGKSKAINTALGHAEGDLLVMTDDDVLPDRNWLTEWRRVADNFPEHSVFGGAIIPHFDAVPPAWPLPEWCYTVLYGATPDYAEGGIEPVNVSGANMAIRKSVNDQGWKFGENFLVGKKGLMGEDSDMVRRLAAAGHKVCFTPRARVHHIIHPEQTSWSWMHRRFFRHGRTMFMLDDVRWDARSKRYEFRFPWNRVRTAAGSAVHLLLAIPTFDKKKMIRQSQPLAYDLGALSQALALCRSKEHFAPNP
jgi:GT2 family glycosyltransferase